MCEIIKVLIKIIELPLTSGTGVTNSSGGQIFRTILYPTLSNSASPVGEEPVCAISAAQTLSHAPSSVPVAVPKFNAAFALFMCLFIFLPPTGTDCP